MFSASITLRSVMLTMLLLVGGFALAPATSQAQDNFQVVASCTGGDGVYLYELPNFQGRCIRLTSSTSDLSTLGFNNITSSIRIVGGYSATLFVDQLYRGASSTFFSDDANLANDTIGDNRASAIQIAQVTVTCDGAEGVYLYDLPNYQGRCLKLTADQPDLRTPSFDDTASSVRIIGNYTVTLYRDLNFTPAATASTFTADDPNLIDNTIGDNLTTSVRVLRTGLACDGKEGIYLYEHPNFQGRCIRFIEDNADLSPAAFNDAASSIRVLGNWATTLYRDLNYTGISNNFSADDPNLADNPIGDNQVTSLRVVKTGVTCDGGEGVYLYEHPNYQGRCLKLTADSADLRLQAFDDFISSVRIVGNWTVTLYRDLNFTGSSSSFFYTEDANLADDAIGDNQATSLRIQRVGLSCDGGEGVYLYEHPNYQGACVRFVTSAPDLRRHNLNDAVSSVRFVGNWTATLWRDLSGTGLSTTFTSDSPEISGTTLGDNQATSLTLARR